MRFYAALVEVLWLVAFTAFLFSGCRSCPPLATRCAGQVAQLCGDDGRWRQLADCSKVKNLSGQPFACGEVPGGHACVPK